MDGEARADSRKKPGESDVPRSSIEKWQEKMFMQSATDIPSDYEKPYLGKGVMHRSSRSSLSPGNENAIMIRDGEFGWDKEKEPILTGVQMDVPKGKLTMVVGPVGCGKSTLLKAILGEVPLTKGSVQLTTMRVGYCDQTPWHMNCTIRESIIGIGEYDRQWYNTVISACALEQDLTQMPKGDRTTIGSKGIALSGGQSQRIVSTERSLPGFLRRNV